MLDSILTFLSNYLIEFMTFMLSMALVFRWLAYKSSRYDQVYFLTFARELEKNLKKDVARFMSPEEIKTSISDLLDKIIGHLPERSLRFRKKKEDEKRKESKFGAKKVVTIRDFVGGKRSLAHGILTEINSFQSQFPPNFHELSYRIMGKDENWVKLFGQIHIDKVSKMIDIMPGLFVVIGIFGTFIGIGMALPEIAKIDLSNLEASSGVLNNFVLHVTFAMKTSIAGILFSLILTVLNALFPIKKVRNAIQGKVENSLEMLWYNYHSESYELSKICESVTNIEKYLIKHSKHPNEDKTG